MENFVITFTAKPGKDDAVASFYSDLQPEYDRAKGFRGRQILRAKPGTMANALRKVMTAEQMAQHPEPENDGSVHFISENIDNKIMEGMSTIRGNEVIDLP